MVKYGKEWYRIVDDVINKMINEMNDIKKNLFLFFEEVISRDKVIGIFSKEKFINFIIIRRIK